MLDDGGSFEGSSPPVLLPVGAGAEVLVEGVDRGVLDSLGLDLPEV